MKKTWSLFLIIACLTLVFSVPVFADTPVMQGTYNTNNTNTSMNANNYRANAAENNDMDWGWLGLIGLAGLAGLRNRSRDRERT